VARQSALGGAPSVLAMGGLVAALISGPDHGWTSAVVLAPVIGALAATAGFVWWELRGAHPMVDLRTIARRAVAGPGVVQGALLFAVAGLLFLLTQLLQVLDGYSRLGVALLGSVFNASIAETCPPEPSTWRAPRFKAR